MDISAYKKDDHVYWKYMHDKCFNNEVGEAFYNYLNEKDLTNFNDKVVPLSVGKKDAISNRLDLISKFIKYNYVLKKKAIHKVQVDDLYNEYKEFSDEHNGKSKPKSKIDFNADLRTRGIKYYKSGSKNIFDMNLESLNAMAKSGNWIHELDIYEDDTQLSEKPLTKNVQKYQNTDFKNDIIKEYDLLEKKYEDLKKAYELLNSKYNNLENKEDNKLNIINEKLDIIYEELNKIYDNDYGEFDVKHYEENFYKSEEVEETKQIINDDDCSDSDSDIDSDSNSDSDG